MLHTNLLNNFNTVQHIVVEENTSPNKNIPTNKQTNICRETSTDDSLRVLKIKIGTANKYQRLSNLTGHKKNEKNILIAPNPNPIPIPSPLLYHHHCHIITITITTSLTLTLPLIWTFTLPYYLY